MSSPRLRAEMADRADIYLERCLKNWVSSKQPPADGRARLLRAAALEAHLRNFEQLPQRGDPKYATEWRLPMLFNGLTSRTVAFSFYLSPALIVCT